MTNLVLLLLALVAANLPWFSERLFYVVPLKNGKHMGWCLFELIVLYFVVGAIAFYAERATVGQNAPQSWQFYTVTACLFLVFAFPGFVYRYFWKK